MTSFSDLERNLADADEAQRAKIVNWIADELQGEVVSIERERRWRPIWLVQYTKDGKEAGLVVKSMRPFEAIPFSLQHEMLCQQVLEENGFPVPHVFGKIDDNTFVMEFIEGEKDPCLVTQADEATKEMSPERWQACLSFMEWLVKLHRLPVEKYAHTEAKLPKTADEVSLIFAEQNYAMVQRRGAVDAVTEFFIRWMRRYVPKHRTRPSIVFGDGAQFMTRGSDVAAIIDFEVSHVADPYNDFAPLRCRTPLENFGDIPALLRHYEKVSGEPLDWKAVAYATVVYSGWGMSGYTTAFKESHVGGDWSEVVLGRAFIMRRTLDAMADYMGITLDDDLQLPAPAVTPMEDSGLRKLIMEIDLFPVTPAFSEWQRDILASIPKTLLQRAHYGQWIDGEYMKDITALLGRDFTDIEAADDALKSFVENAGADDDEQLVRLFHRHAYRQCLVIAGEGAGKDHIMLTKLVPILDKNGEPIVEMA